jgi:anti-sigma factor RsiW
MDTETHELIAGYALDALDDVDRLAVEELLATSEEAREELRSFAEVAAALAVGATATEPTQGLRDRIIESARAERQVVVPFARGLRRCWLRRPRLQRRSLSLSASGDSRSHTISITRARLSINSRASVGFSPTQLPAPWACRATRDGSSWRVEAEQC